ncbi:hypothetical protein HPP92_026264 [Vanilla planifolia]|uniref:Uncharacterized protein n=1 Tax=Vanilla planifolia TaxID=51239 RepID=A0A835PEB4_VANPL|nr:hypothetical protein HPP92_026264 [Vanilla planifolia]
MLPKTKQSFWSSSRKAQISNSSRLHETVPAESFRQEARHCPVRNSKTEHFVLVAKSPNVDFVTGLHERVAA